VTAGINRNAIFWMSFSKFASKLVAIGMACVPASVCELADRREFLPS